ncbi:hypothetical protein F751_4435 [Auxenochlorella protothecoides]|uniref:Uncharacterized protein n=1 Tax=Auxenochlorella protothecoides TaxID=3075 RepID=A0A087SN61_AUXPR|nr:hypothetical protein F751_4435 [Auxenochlorella protothecoides]KFM27165.1 hypothetical protein F751_4435 [Auxenochlorella protothecoides]
MPRACRQTMPAGGARAGLACGVPAPPCRTSDSFWMASTVLVVVVVLTVGPLPFRGFPNSFLNMPGGCSRRARGFKQGGSSWAQAFRGLQAPQPRPRSQQVD